MVLKKPMNRPAWHTGLGAGESPGSPFDKAA
jgi:hypothetical protein